MKKYLLLFALLLMPLLVNAEKVEINGIYYYLYTYSKEAYVTENPNKYTGKVVIPASVTYNGVECSVTSIGDDAFKSCNSLTSITIPNSVTRIGGWAFSNCSGLTSVTIPNSVTSIEEHAFAVCSGLTSVTIPNSLTSIGVGVFRSCSSLTSVTIPGSVTSIEGSAFLGCSGLTSITIPNSVTSIGSGAFLGCSGLTSITIPNSVTRIGDEAFSSCSGLTSVTIPNSVTTVGNYVFSGCSSLTSVTIPSSVTFIGYHAFAYCNSLTSVTIPSSVTRIGSSAFFECNRLTSVHISDITAWCKIVFSNNDSNPLSYAHHLYIGEKEITDIVIPNSVTSIGNFAFYKCSCLTSVTIPQSVTSIGNNAFYGCSGLIPITIGSGVKSIGSKAFALCSKMRDVYCLADDVPSTSSDVFEYSYANRSTLHVPESAINKYKAVEPWSTFKSIVSLNGNTYYTLTYMVDGDVYKTYKLAAGSTITPEPEPTKTGYTFSGWSEIPEIMPEHDVTVYGTFVMNIKTYTLTISATGNGYASYSGTTIRNKTSSFTVNEGTNATITFSPDTGYRIKSVKVGSTDVTASVSNNRYTVSNIQGNKTVSVVFEAIPPTTYTLTISATGNGYASYSGTTIRNKTSSFTVNEGTNATITFSPDTGYRIKSLKVGSTDVTASVSNNRYTVSNIQGNKTVSVVFEAIPPTTYTLTISATGNGYASYGGTTIRNKTSSFTVNEGTNATITFSPDTGYRIKSLKIGSTDVTASVSNNRYTVSNIQGNKTVSVVFEAIPPTTYTLTISATGNGYASYNGTTIRNKTTTFTVNEGTNATITFSPDNGYRIKSVKVGSSDVTASVSNNRYTVSNIQSNKTVAIVFEAIIKPGDANNDGLVSVTDVGCAINYILEQSPSVFVFEAADMNGDNSVSVTDVGMIINLILSESAASRTGENALETNNQNGHNSIVPRVSLTSTADGYKLMLEQKDAFIGFQFDVELAENATINGMQLADDDEHVITCHRLSNGKWRVVCYSPTNSTFNADETALLTFATTGDVMISDMRLTTTGLDELRPAAIFGTTTGITNVKQDMKISVDGHTLRIFSVRDTTLRIVSMGGAYRTLKVKEGENCFESLRAGVYMINNQKVILR